MTSEAPDLDPALEATVRERLHQHHVQLACWHADFATDSSLSVDYASLRFAYLLPRLPEELRRTGTRVLVSGMGSGSEMLAARRAGFSEVHGTELDSFLVELCTLRLGGDPGFHPRQVNGRDLPYPDGFFPLIVSGHIVEHTEDPGRYVAEHLRVLAPGGYFLLEFPSRFHHTELHTGLPSVEWLPLPIRNAILRHIGHGTRFSEGTRRKCRVILETGLKPVSLGRVRRWVEAAGHATCLVARGTVSPGVVFALIKKSA